MGILGLIKDVRREYRGMTGPSSRYTVEKKRTRIVSTPYSLLAVDQQGRALGTVVKTSEVTFVPAPKLAQSGYTIPPGYYFALSVSLSRDGKYYDAAGAKKLIPVPLRLEEEMLFSSEVRRQRAINRYLIEARKRASVMYKRSNKKMAKRLK